MKIEMQIILEVNNQAENFYEDAVRLGDHAAYALTIRHRSQVAGLENIAESALKVSDILDYVKRQTARFSYWRQILPADMVQRQVNEISTARRKPDENDPVYKNFGLRLRIYLEKNLKDMRNIICSRDRLNISGGTDKERELRRRVYLLLIRQFVRQMVIEYEVQGTNAEPSKKGA